MAESSKTTSPFAETVDNPYRFGRQYVVFELLRSGHSRKTLLSGLIEQEVRKQTQGETRDAKSLLDKVLHDLRHKKGFDVITGEGGGYRLLPQGSAVTGAQPEAETDEQEEVRLSPPEPPAESVEAEAGRSDGDVEEGDHEESSLRERPEEAPFNPDDYTIHDITDIYEAEREERE